MNNRTKILAGAFGVFILYALVSQLVYPKWIKPWFTLDEQIAAKEEERAELQDLRDQVGKAREEYRAWVDRIGSFDTQQVMTDVRDRLNQLIEKHQLEEAKVTPNRASTDRKTGKTVTGVTVTATGNLASAIGFLKDVSELPHLIRVMNPSFSPATSARRGVAEDRLNIKMPLELWVLPQHKVVEHIEPASIVRPEFYVRHQGRDYSPIWTGQPFTDYVDLVAQATPNNVQVQVGQNAALNVSASGGHGNYKFEWAPPEGLTDPASPTPKVDTSEAGNKRYTVTVTDATGHKAQATVMVNVTNPPPAPPPVETKPTQPTHVVTKPTGPQPWLDAGSWEIRMALLQKKGAEREDELMLFNTANQTRKYMPVGGEFDGGTLLYVHQRGGVALRGDQYLVYPLGLPLSNAVPADQAQDYPELQRAALFHRDAVAELSRKKEVEAATAKAPGLQIPFDESAGETDRAVIQGNGPLAPVGTDGQEGPPSSVAADGAQGPPTSAANDGAQGSPADAADVTAAPAGTAGTRDDGPPANAAGTEKQANEGQTGSPKPPATKRRPVRNRKPR